MVWPYLEWLAEVSKMSKTLKITLYTSLTLVGMLLLSLYFFFSPENVSFFPKCPFHSLTGLHCPGCGSQRSIHAILHGEIWTALQYNFLILLAFLVLSYKLFLWLFPYRKKDQKQRKNILYATATPWVIFALIIGFWILRNIPIKPFTYLAP